MTQYNRFMGEYSDNTDYEKGDVVVFGGAAYYRKMPGKGISPIARKKPYLVWSRLNENLSTVFPLGGGSGGGNTGGGGGLPSVSDENNGQFLRVVNGAWAAVAVPSAEGVSF